MARNHEENRHGAAAGNPGAVDAGRGEPGLRFRSRVIDGAGAVSFAGERRSLDTPADDPFGQDSDPYPVPPAAPELLGAALLVQLRATADLDAARGPGAHGHQVVDDDGDPGIRFQVAPFL